MQIKNNTAIFHSANRTISRTISKHMHTYMNNHMQMNACTYQHIMTCMLAQLNKQRKTKYNTAIITIYIYNMYIYKCMFINTKKNAENTN